MSGTSPTIFSATSVALQHDLSVHLSPVPRQLTEVMIEVIFTDVSFETCEKRHRSMKKQVSNDESIIAQNIEAMTRSMIAAYSLFPRSSRS